MKKTFLFSLGLIVAFASLFVSCGDKNNDANIGGTGSGGDVLICKVSVSNTEGGRVKITDYIGTSANVLIGNGVEVVAVPDDGYNFIGWFVDGSKEPVSVDETFTFIASENITLLAKFDKSFVVSAKSSGGGTVSFKDIADTSLKDVLIGSEVTVIAVPDENCDFLGWFIGDSAEPISIDATYTFTVLENVTLVAKFNKWPLVSISSAADGSVSFENSAETSLFVQSGSEVTVIAVPDENCDFLGWYLGNSEEPISTESTYTFTVNENVDLVAKFLRPTYGEGLTIISKDKDSKSMLSFMQAPIVEGGIGTFIDGDCFTINNPNIDFASGVADIVQCNGSLIIACQGGSENGDLPTIYYLNENTLVMEDMITVSEYDDFKPVKLAFPRNISQGVRYPILCDNGKVYDFEITEGVVLESIKMQSTYSQACLVENNGYSGYNILFWDKEVNAATLIYNGYGPFCYGQKYLLERDDPEFNDFNYFKGIKGLITLTEIRCTNEQVETSERETLILLQGKFTAQKLVIPTFPWRYVEDTAYMTFVDNGGLKTIGTKVPLDENTPCVANRTYQSLLFADGNKVRRWYYTSNVQINKADTFDLGLSDDAVITAIDISEDHRKTYIAFYEPNQEGKNGSVWVISTDTGEVLEKYDNVCYQPVKMIYKKK